MKNFLIVLLILTVTACASSRGFDRGALHGQLTEQKVVTEDDIKQVMNLKPQLPDPFRLALYFAQPKSVAYYRNSWRWLDADKDALLGIVNELKGKKIVSDMFVISDAIVEGADNKALRLAAARAGADAVVIVNGVSDIDRYNNSLGVAYVLLVTPLFVPGTVADGLFMANASMWDVRNQYLYLSVESEGTATETKPAAFINENRLIKTAKSDALAALRKELLEHLLGMSGR
jgi:hypothetical protein